ncbi:MAG: hypothetical protein ACFFBJ_11580 [Promethearchaeota archaeon]
MAPMWGSKQWQLLLAIAIIFIFGYGTYTILSDLIVGHPIWWYNASFILFALTLLGLLLLVRQGWKTLQNIGKFGFHPSKSESMNEEIRKDEEESDYLRQIADETYHDSYFEEDED